MQTSDMFEVDNQTLIYITANGAIAETDMARRMLVIHLHIHESRAEERRFKRPLEMLQSELSVRKSWRLSTLT